jgi:hypothetical protein
MAKSYHLKEIIDGEIEKSAGKPIVSSAKDEMKAQPFKHSSADQFIDELKLWKAALKIETFAPGHSN